MRKQTPRIVSLLPSATEMVCALGLKDALAGIKHDCIFAFLIMTIPVIPIHSCLALLFFAFCIEARCN